MQVGPVPVTDLVQLQEPSYSAVPRPLHVLLLEYSHAGPVTVGSVHSHVPSFRYVPPTETHTRTSFSALAAALHSVEPAGTVS